MRTIHKYPLVITEEQELQVPVTSHGGGPDFLHVGLDALGKPCVWLEVDTEGKLMPCKLFIIGTGTAITSAASQHLGSFVHGSYVWHAYV